MFRGAYFGSFTQLLLYYAIMFAIFVYLIYKYGRHDSIYFYVIILFFPSFWMAFGANNIYRIFTLLIALYVTFSKNTFKSYSRKDSFLTYCFVLFSIVFLYTSINAHDRIFLMLSQYSIYVVTFLSWFIIKKEIIRREGNMVIFNQLLFFLLLAQIIMAISKLIIFTGRTGEWLVGTMSFIGGGLGTVIPIVGFVFLWLYRKGVFEKKDWLFTAGLLLIGFATGKRAIWFMFPVVVALFMIYVPKIKMNKYLWMGIIIAPLVFYLGTRLNPSLNPEHKVWGSFDIDYVFDYADTYQFGKEKAQQYESEITTENTTIIAQGRGGVTNSLFEKFFSGEDLTEQDWLGIGLTAQFTTSYEEYSQLGLNIHSKGSATGAFQSYATSGYLGLITTILLLYSILRVPKHKRIKLVLILIVAWEYFYYSGSLLRTPTMMFILIYCIHYSNLLVWQGKNRKLN